MLTFEKAASRLDEIIRDSPNAKDRDYYAVHRDRFRRAALRFTELKKPPARILDVGSHYLHFGAFLALLGYEVHAMDVPVFCEMDFVRKRAADLGITLLPCERIDRGDFAPGGEDRFDAVNFCEIMEHITFNPVLFWKRIYGLLAPGGIIYITTPNSLRVINLFHAVKEALLLRGVGTDLRSILLEVTYGHHWKEYSASEIRRYFAALSPDFRVEIRPYRYRTAEAGGPSLRKLLKKLAAPSVIFCEELEAVVSLPSKTAWLLSSPNYS
ncbi:MAG TPA: class I SAM-dependent methyltransferase [Candidatus Eisenbacteria bacterium]|jgi:2-polyprenyl-6-hydroxyphenyl methylase/3-demethylubiquinone-9 3-methyltransferase|nr:class I SAM-dependent methyltransferase [Candidatus Eisenbacteria bacterium]